MLDAKDLLETMKKAATDAVDASKPVNIVFGKVVKVKPLEINIEQKMTLKKSQLILTRNVTDYKTKVTGSWNTENKTLNANHTHELTGDISVSSKATISPNPDNETINISNTINDNKSVKQTNINLSHLHSINLKKETITIHNELELEDEVILLRMQGGQKYIVLDRVVGQK